MVGDVFNFEIFQNTSRAVMKFFSFLDIAVFVKEETFYFNNFKRNDKP